MGNTVILEKKDRICILTLNEPEKLNAMSDEMAPDFRAALNEIKADKELKVLIVTGAGRAFSAGGNLQKILNRANANPAESRKYSYQFYNSFLRIRELGIPTIAAVNGHAVGAGACLSLACDMRIAATDSKFGFTFAKIGLYPGMGAEYFLLRTVGRARTFELLMTGDIISAEEAYRIGLINHLSPPEKLMDNAMKLAEKIAAMPSLPIKMLKESIDAAANSSLLETLQREASYQAINYLDPDLAEGVRAKMEKRKPNFKNEY